MEFLADYGLFIAKLATVVIAILIVFTFLAALIMKAKHKESETHGSLHIKKLNKKYQKFKETVLEEIASKKEYKKILKAAKKAEKTAEKKRLFVLDFQGDIRASQVCNLREEITAILLACDKEDEVLLRLESPGGMVNTYGLAASQLQRLRDADIKLTVAIDKMAASGGYLMASVANEIMAAPFAIIGSIGVVFQLPNFHRYLDKKHIDFEQVTAGEYKRTLTVFGKNTDEDRAKVQEEINDIHAIFKDFLAEHRPQINLEKVATGEHWLASQAFQLKLVDKLSTSDAYLQKALDAFDIYKVAYKIKQPLSRRISIGFSNTLNKVLHEMKFYG